MGGERRLALVVAVDRYDHAALHRLASPAADADALAEVLGDAALGDFEVETLHNPTSWAAAERVEQVLSDRHSTDLVLLHFSCHGLKDESGELFLAATNTRPDLLGSTAIDAAWVNRVMQRSRAQRVVLLLDCCYGGAFERGVIARAAGGVDVGDQFRQRQLGEGRGRVVITASTAMEYAFEGARLAEGSASQPSVFTGALVEGIRTGDADRDQDGHVSLGELYDYVYDRVREHTPNQTPSKWEFGLRGDLYVARNPHRRPPSGVLAPELLELTRHPMAAVRRAAVHELAAILSESDSESPRSAAARLALHRLADDDSRQVSAAALEALSDPEPPPTTEPAPAPAPEAAALAPEPAPEPAPAPAAEAQPILAPTSEAAPAPAAEATPAPAAEVSTKAAAERAPATAAAERGRATAAATAAAETAASPAGPKFPPPPDKSGAGAPDRPARLRQAFVVVGIIALLAAAGIVIIWAGNRTNATNPTTTARDYNGLLSMLPAALRDTCHSENPDRNSTAAASCEPGAYELWQTKDAMDQDQGADLAGACTTPPTANRPAAERLPTTIRTGRIACNYVGTGGSDGYYVVSWGIDDLLMTGTFHSDAGADESAYSALYNQALDMLKQM
ncbi:caspase family protein [Actinoplanes sp. CA-142083]|uniref:caspase family protein n=1 Tax=Actinoplanes sp. CA-142083 TaxID=3239903 RepID=UPI003D9360BB